MTRILAGVLAATVLAFSLALWFQGRGIDRLTADRDNWRQSARTYDAAWKAWSAAYWQSEKLRDQERRNANTAASEDAKSCDARVASARSSASAITRIVTKEVQCAPGTSPVRRLIDPRELRDALTPAAASGATEAPRR